MKNGNQQLGLEWALPRALMVLVIFALLSGCDQSPSTSGKAVPTAAAASPRKIELIPPTNMVPIKAGTFMRVKYPITLTHDYWMGKYEVTQGEFASVLGRNPSHFVGDSNRPVEKVTLLDANAYCASITQSERAAGHLTAGYEYRLPTEAEWEYACLAGSTNRFSFSEEPGIAEQFAWTAENSDATTHPVGSKRPNAWGLYDMHGNVWEWCSDWFEPYPAMPLTDPVGPASSKYKLFKGGGWNQDLEYARAVNRFMMSPSNGIHFVGFRIALGPVQPLSIQPTQASP